MRTTTLFVLLLTGCTLDFDTLERGRADGGTAMDAHVDTDGSARDAGRDATTDTAIVVDAYRADTGEDAGPDPDAYVGVDAHAGADAFVGVDAFVPAVDAHVVCPTVDCNDPECLGRSCDDGHVC